MRPSSGPTDVDTVGRTHDDADLLIAAFARRLRATVVTNDTGDFADLEVPVVDWMVEDPAC